MEDEISIFVPKPVPCRNIKRLLPGALLFCAFTLLLKYFQMVLFIVINENNVSSQHTLRSSSGLGWNTSRF